MALMFQKSGRNVFIVIERMKELSMVLETAKKLKVKPQIGFRLKLTHTVHRKMAQQFWFKVKIWFDHRGNCTRNKNFKTI